MRILFICDLNSIHARKWISFFIKRDHQVTIFSTTPFQESFLGSRVFSRGVAPLSTAPPAKERISPLFRFIPKFWLKVFEKLFVFKKMLQIRFETRRHRYAVSPIAASIQPDVIHALRIPNEGFVSSQLELIAPRAVSTWGNDLMYWARKKPLAGLTRRTLQRTDLLLSDCRRDVVLGREYGYAPHKPVLVIPGAGGMSNEDLRAGKNSLRARGDFLGDAFGISEHPIFLSLRGFGSQDIDNEPLFNACAHLEKRGQAFRLVVAGQMNGFRHQKLVRLIKELRLDDSVLLIDHLSHADALRALQSADFSISVSRNDGVPNSMLEAMTFGAIPVMSDIESIREWIEEGANGYLFDPTNPESIAGAMQKAAREKKNHPAMRRRNHTLVSKNGNYGLNMLKAEQALVRLADAARGHTTSRAHHRKQSRQIASR